MKKPLTNFAFIDGQNLHRGMAAIGWALDYERFRRYLAEKHGVGTAYMFIGYLPEYQGLYQSLQKAGYVLVFKEVLRRADKQVKGNVDAELVLQAMIDYPNYAEAVIVTSDGDFACLVRYLREQQKLRAVVSPLRDHCSVLLRKAARHHIQFLDRLRVRLEYQKSERHPPAGASSKKSEHSRRTEPPSEPAHRDTGPKGTGPSEFRQGRDLYGIPELRFTVSTFLYPQPSATPPLHPPLHYGKDFRRDRRRCLARRPRPPTTEICPRRSHYCRHRGPRCPSRRPRPYR